MRWYDSLTSTHDPGKLELCVCVCIEEEEEAEKRRKTLEPSLSQACNTLEQGKGFTEKITWYKIWNIL